MSEITPATFLEVGRLMIANFGGRTSVLMPAALLSALVLCVLLIRGRHTQANIFASAALVLMVVSLIITLAVNVPIDRQIQPCGAGRPITRRSETNMPGRHGRQPRDRTTATSRNAP